MAGWISPDALSRLIGDIYESAIDPARWPAAMDAVRLELNCFNASLSIQAFPDFATILSVNIQIPPAYEHLLNRSGADIADLWGGLDRLAAHPVDLPAIQSQLNPAFDAASSDNPYYLDFARPQGLIDVMAIFLARDAQALGTLAFGRHEHAGPFGRREAEIARLLTPHLQRAATINRMLDLSALASASFMAVIDRFATPIVIVDASMRVDHANPAAVELLDRSEPLAWRSGNLRAARSGIDHALAVAVEAACRDGTAMGRKGLEIPTRDGRDGEFVLHVLPLPVTMRGHKGEGRAAIFVGQARTAFIASEELLAALFALTPAEARVFGEIAAGNEVKRIAGRLGVAPSTVQTHIRRLLQKTGSRRQVELVQIAASLTTPVR